jgi:hydroxysqualene dehydroxylase
MSDVVIGGGLAGITAALDLADAGRKVTLLEARPRLGGATFSVERDGLWVDNGQHVFLKCCTAYRGLLDRIGAASDTELQSRLAIPVVRPGGRVSWLRRTSLPAPLHLGASIARFGPLSPRDRVRLVPAILALMELSLDDPSLDEETFAEWLSRHKQRRSSFQALWDLIALPTLNLPAADASLALAAFVFQTGLLARADAGDIGFHVGTLQQIVGDPARRALADAGVDVRLGWRAERLERLDGGGYRLSGRGASGAEALDARTAVVALPHDRAGALLEPLLGPNAGRPATLAVSPIVNLHIVYDRRVIDEPFAAGVGTPVQYLFDRTEAAGAPGGHQYLAVSLSGAAAEMRESVPALRERYLAAMAALLPRAGTATVERFQVTREHAATFAALPGTAALRPGARTALAGLVLAGAWTDTGWPATLEGAVLSGRRAATVVLEDLGIGRPGEPTPERASGPAGEQDALAVGR